MRKLALFAALAASMLCHGEGDTSVDWWFTPENWVDSKDITVYLTKADGTTAGSFTVEYGADENTIATAIANALEEKGTAPQAYALATKALAQSLVARLENKRQDEKILTLAKSLDVAILGDNYEYVDPSGNPVMGVKRTAGYGEMKDSIMQGRQFVTGSKPDNESHPIQIKLKSNLLDANMLESVATPECTGDEKLWTLKGFYNKGSYGDFWNHAADGKYYVAPMFAGDNGNWTGTLTWYYFGGIDLGSLYSKTADGDVMSHKLTLRGWNEEQPYKHLSTLLTSKETADREEAGKLAVLVRKTEGESENVTHTLKYLDFGDVIGASDSVPPDECSIETYISTDNTKTNLTIYGFNENIPTDESEGAMIPYTSVDSLGEGDDPVLLWGGIENFVAETVFKKSEKSGKLILNGTSEEGKFAVLAIQTGEEGEEEQTLATFSGDGMSIDFGYTPDGGTFQKYAQLHNFDDPTRNGAHTDNDFADILTNATIETDGWYVPLRTDGVLQYAPLAKITGIPSASVDDLTIENTADNDAGEDAPTKLRIKGAQDASEGQFLKMGSGGEVVWEAATVGLDCEPSDEDEFPLYTNIVGGVVKFGLQNWDTIDNYKGVYGKKDNSPVMWRMDDSRSLECDTTHDTIEVANSVSAVNRAIPYKDKTNSEGDTIGWLAPPSSNPNGKYLKVTGTGNSATLAWADGGSGAPVDDATITTNYNHGAMQNGVAGIYGFRTADTDDVPHKKADGTIEWKPVAAGGALLIQGNYNSTVGTCTNKLIFASESDSNVKFKVTQGQNGNVTVTVGVYWK